MNKVTVQRSEDLLIQLPEECGFECGEKVNIECMDNGSIRISHLVNIEIDLDDNIILKLALMAHERDITLNELLCESIKDGISQGEKSWQKA